MKIIEEPNKIPTVSAFDMEVGQVGLYHYTGFFIKGFTDSDICVRDSAGLRNLSNLDFRIGVDRATLKKCRIKSVATVHPAQPAALSAWDLTCNDFSKAVIVGGCNVDYTQYTKGCIVFRAGDYLCNVTNHCLLKDYFTDEGALKYPNFQIRILPKGTKIEL